MIKTVAIGFWVCLVTLASTWAGANYFGGEAKPAQDGKPLGDLQELKPRPVSVPIITDGAIQGYVSAQLAFTVKKETYAQLAVKPDAFVVDEVFKSIYQDETVNFKRLKKQDIDALAKRIKDGVNHRFGSPFVEDVLFEDINYVPMEKVRGGAKKE